MSMWLICELCRIFDVVILLLGLILAGINHGILAFGALQN